MVLYTINFACSCALQAFAFRRSVQVSGTKLDTIIVCIEFVVIASTELISGSRTKWTVGRCGLGFTALLRSGIHEVETLERSATIQVNMYITFT